MNEIINFIFEAINLDHVVGGVIVAGVGLAFKGFKKGVEWVDAFVKGTPNTLDDKAWDEVKKVVTEKIDELRKPTE